MRDLLREILGGNRPLDGVKLETAGARDGVDNRRAARTAERHRDRLLPGLPLPDGERLALRTLGFRRPVVAPAHDHGDGRGLSRHQEAQAHRGGKEALLRRPALLAALFGKAGGLGDLAEILVLVGIGSLLGGRPGRDQKAGQVPVRRAGPLRQPLPGQLVPRPRADEFELQGFDQTLPDVERGRQTVAHDAASSIKLSGFQICSASRWYSACRASRSAFLNSGAARKGRPLSSMNRRKPGLCSYACS